MEEASDPKVEEPVVKPMVGSDASAKASLPSATYSSEMTLAALSKAWLAGW